MTRAAPSLPADFVERWGIQSTKLIADTRTSLVHRVIRRDGSRAITKQLKPEGLHELSGVDFLEWRQGHGGVRVLDRQGASCLLEDAGTLMLKDYRLQHGEDAANDIILSVLSELHSASASALPDRLVPLWSHFQPLFERASKEDRPDLSAALTYAASIVDELLSLQVGIRPLHGDLHHENIVSGSARGWLAIDPQGFLAIRPMMSPMCSAIRMGHLRISSIRVGSPDLSTCLRRPSAASGKKSCATRSRMQVFRSAGLWRVATGFREKAMRRSALPS